MAEQRDGLADLEPVANGTTLRPLSYYSERPSNRRGELADDLYDRDARPTMYARTSLIEGDTLVFIRFPNDQIFYDDSGFPLSDRHLVHREKLLQTGSEKFIKVLTSPDIQFKLQRRLGCVNKLPPSVKYVMDLTPPEEGDEALELTSALCCSLGIRQWYTAAKRCGVADNLVGGHDETATLQIHGDFEYTGEEVLEYSTVRHRTGIERLLRVIEGMDPGLDSAPKVWTLVVLAKYFGCAKAVEDHIISWMLADPNCKFVEILPEATLRIGVMLENYQLTRSAFAVLVSEEALRMGTGKFFKDITGPPHSIPYTPKGHTRLHRPMEDIDEDWVNLIQYASRSFFARIYKAFENLLAPSMVWLHNLPEYIKVTNFEIWVCDSKSKLSDSWKTAILNLRDRVCDYVRGRLLYCMIATLEHHAARDGQANRYEEAYLGSTQDDFGNIYNSLNDRERIMTRFFWAMIANLDWSTNLQSNKIFNPLYTGHPFHGKNIEIAQTHGVANVSSHQLKTLALNLNKAILDACRKEKYNDGNIPESAYTVADPWNDLDPWSEPTSQRAEDLNEGVSDLNLGSPRPAKSQPKIRASTSTVQQEELKQERSSIGISDNFAEFPFPFENDTELYDAEIYDAKQYDENRALLKSTAEALSIDQAAPSAPTLTATAQALSIDPGSPSTATHSPFRTFNRWFRTKSGQTSTAAVEEERFAQYWNEAASTNKAWPPPASGPSSSQNPQPNQTSFWNEASDPHNQKKKPATARSTEPHVPEDIYLGGPDCIFFSLRKLLYEVSIELSNVCHDMLDKGEMEFASICDTLLCLSDEEFKYLPLWAGGLDDGSGGVFQDFVPPAERGGPSQPGPSYHTGSTLNSAASSEINFDGEGSGLGSYTEEGIATSLGVGDGYSDQLDRLVVYSESEFPMEDPESIGGGYVISVAGSGMESTEDTLSEGTLLEDLPTILDGGSVATEDRMQATMAGDGHAEDGNVAIPSPESHPEIDHDSYFFASDDGGDLDDDMEDFDGSDYDDGELTETED